MKVEVKDEKNGKYSVSYIVSEESKGKSCEVSVSVWGKQIKGSPFEAKVGMSSLSPPTDQSDKAFLSDSAA